MKRLFLAVALLCVSMKAQVTVAPILQPHQTYLDASGSPCAGCKFYSYTAGTTTPRPTYTDAGGNTQNTNPITLSAQGGANIWVDTSVAYKFTLKTAAGATVWTVDYVQSPVVSTVALPPSGVFTDNLTVGNPTAITSVNDPVLGDVPTRFVSKGATNDDSTNSIAGLDASGRPVAQFSGTGRLNLDGYQNGGPVIDLRNWTTLSSGGLIGHYAFGMKTDANQPITSGGIFHIMNSSAQHSVSTTINLEFARNLDASTCISFCQPNGLISAGAGGLAIYDGLPILCIDQTTLNNVQCQIGKVLQLRPLAPSDTFTFPNNSDNWLHVDAAKNIRFINDGTQVAIQSVANNALSFQPLAVNASILNLNTPVAISNNLSVIGSIGAAINNSVTIKPVGTGTTDLAVQNYAGSINNFTVNDTGSITLHPAAFSTFGACIAGLEGSIAAVNDSSTTTYGAAVSGGGTGHIKMYCDGTTWLVN